MPSSKSESGQKTKDQHRKHKYWTDHAIDMIAYPFEKWPVLGEMAMAGFAVWLASKAHKY